MVERARKSGLALRRLASRFWLPIAIGALLALVVQFSGLLGALENDSFDTRFSLRPAERAPSNVVLLTVSKTYAYSRGLNGIAPARSELARAVELLNRARPALIVLDFLFTARSAREPAGERSLEDAIRREGDVATAFYDVDSNGEYFLFGQPGPPLARHLRLVAGSVAGKEPVRTVPYELSYPTTPRRSWLSLPVVADERLSGHAITSSDLPGGSAWIDYYGPPGTLTQRAFGGLLDGAIPSSSFTGKVVVVGVDDPSVDRHLTSASPSTRMAGVEVLANQIMTVVRGFPLRSTGPALNVLLILLLVVAAPLSALYVRPVWTVAIAGLVAGVYLALAQLEFDAGHVLPVIAPMVGLAVALATTGVLHYRLLSRERQRLRELFAQMDPAVVASVLDTGSGDRFDLTPSSIVAGYRIETLVAEGGMGAIYRATEAALERNVALKLIRPDHATDPIFRERFVRESRMAASIDHPNVIPIYEAGEDRGVLFIAMRYVDGVDLDTSLRLRGRLDPAGAVAVLRQLVGAVEAAHQVGLIHRDLKPSNVLLTPDELPHVYLTDFGIATRPDADPARDGGTGHPLGSVNYMAPEQLRGEPVTPLVDVYALGGILYAMLTAQAPYPSDSATAIMWAHINAPPPRPSSRVPGLSPCLDEVVSKAMAKDPQLRYASSVALGRAAGRVVGQPSPQTPDPPPVQPTSPASVLTDRSRTSTSEGLDGP